MTSFKGLFTLILGNGQGSNNAALPLTLGDVQYYVGIEADGQPELSPRVSLTAVPYAFVANTVKTVNASTISSGTVPDARLSVHLQDLADGSLTGSKVGTGINASNVTTGTLPASVIPITASAPVGSIVAFAGSTIPTGWLLCDGTTVDRTTFAALFAAIGVNWGGGDGSTTFHLPDLRGRFLRGRDAGAGNDPDAGTRIALFPGAGVSTMDNVGSYQIDEFKNHNHGGGVHNHVGIFTPSQPNGWGNSFDSGSTSSGRLSATSGGSSVGFTTGNSSSIISNNGGSETRPKNAYVNFIIKAQ